VVQVALLVNEASIYTEGLSAVVRFSGKFHCLLCCSSIRHLAVLLTLLCMWVCLQPSPALIGSEMNRTRLRELLQFVLLHFTNGPDARRLNELLQLYTTRQQQHHRHWQRRCT